MGWLESDRQAALQAIISTSNPIMAGYQHRPQWPRLSTTFILLLLFSALIHAQEYDDYYEEYEEKFDDMDLNFDHVAEGWYSSYIHPGFFYIGVLPISICAIQFAMHGNGCVGPFHFSFMCICVSICFDPRRLAKFIVEN